MGSNVAAALELMHNSPPCKTNKTSTSRLLIKEKSTSPQRKINGSAKTATNPPDKVEHIGGAMKPTCCSDRTETNFGNGCSALLLLFAHGAPSLRA